MHSFEKMLFTDPVVGRLQEVFSSMCPSTHQAVTCQAKEHWDSVFILKSVLLIKKTAVQNTRDLEKEVILKVAIEPLQP